MNNYQQCPNGHYYKNELPNCPYCPNTQQSGANTSLDRTAINANNSSNDPLGKTQIIGDHGSSSNDKTIVFGSNNGKRDLSRTFIAEVSDENDGEAKVIKRSSRKLTGWLISYTIDPMGVDFKIFEGNNTIGRDKENSISIATDDTLSGHHATILNKKDKFYLKDEMAANGTFLNGIEIEIGKPYEIKDKDQIRVGATILKFHSAE
jgi:hypothetical protein